MDNVNDNDKQEDQKKYMLEIPTPGKERAENQLSDYLRCLEQTQRPHQQRVHKEKVESNL